jgi:two-component system cell cycle sensor histidine kinase/response regulator CckA
MMARPKSLRKNLQRLIGPPERLIERLAGPFDPLLNLLFQETAAGILVLDRDGAIVRANDMLRRMVARRVDLSPGQPGIGIFRTAEHEAIWLSVRGLLDGAEKNLDFASRLETADLDPDHMVGVIASPLFETDASISGLVLRLCDITAQKRLEAQLAHSQKLQAVGQLAGGIAHDFNNLLTAIGGGAEAILERPVDAETQADARHIQQSAERGAALVRQLLAFGRQQTLQPRPVAVNAAIENLSTLLRRLLGGQIRLELDLQMPGRTVRADPTQLDQVLVNLAVNARDAMAKGGTLTLRSGHITLYRPLTRGQETIPPGRYVMIEVQDTGSGIPADVLPRIFDPFFTTKRDRGGHGLGLSTVHGIVRQSDGFLAVESELGLGTRFRVYLPRYDQDAASDTEPAELAASGGALARPMLSRAVLLVEDEDLVRRLAERVLTQRGWHVLAAASADAALTLLARQEPGAPPLAAVISDVVMPGMDGPTLVRILRGSRSDLPAILVSGYADETLRGDLDSAGLSFLAKPYALKELADALERIVSPNERKVPG